MSSPDKCTLLPGEETTAEALMDPSHPKVCERAGGGKDPAKHALFCLRISVFACRGAAMLRSTTPLASSFSSLSPCQTPHLLPSRVLLPSPSLLPPSFSTTSRLRITLSCTGCVGHLGGALLLCALCARRGSFRPYKAAPRNQRQKPTAPVQAVPEKVVALHSFRRVGISSASPLLCMQRDVGY